MNRILLKTITTLYRIACFLCYYSGLYLLLSYLGRNKPVILTYHSINHPNSPNIYPDNIISIENFEKQIEYLSKKRKIISLDNLARDLQRQLKFSPYTTVITFDDGYYDFFLNAYPILSKYHVPATVFLITGFLDSGGGKWEDRLAFLINMTNSNALRVSLNGKDFFFRTSTEKEKKRSILELNSILQPLSEDERSGTISEIEKAIGHSGVPFPLTTLRRNEVAQLKDYPLLSFGAHTHSHADLGKVDVMAAKCEIRASKKEVEKVTGQKCLLFSYPFGRKKNLTSQVRDLLKTEGFCGAVTAIPGTIESDFDLFKLKRITAVNDASVEFKCVLINLTLQRP